MPSIALEVFPAGLALVRADYVTVAGETFALHRRVPPRLPLGVSTPDPAPGWSVSDPETGMHVGHGRTRAEACADAARTLTDRTAGALTAAREMVLAKQWGLM